MAHFHVFLCHFFVHVSQTCHLVFSNDENNACLLGTVNYFKALRYDKAIDTLSGMCKVYHDAHRTSTTIVCSLLLNSENVKLIGQLIMSPNSYYMEYSFIHHGIIK